MKRILYMIAMLLILSGSLFFLQGLSFVPSRIMYGRQEWVVIGGMMVIVGIIVVVFTFRRRSRTD